MNIQYDIHNHVPRYDEDDKRVFEEVSLLLKRELDRIIDPGNTYKKFAYDKLVSYIENDLSPIESDYVQCSAWFQEVKQEQTVFKHLCEKVVQVINDYLYDASLKNNPRRTEGLLTIGTSDVFLEKKYLFTAQVVSDKWVEIDVFFTSFIPHDGKPVGTLRYIPDENVVRLYN